MELILQQNTAVGWTFEAKKRLATPKNIGEILTRVPFLLATIYDNLHFEINYQITWFLRKLLFSLI
jgi:hypothetical protein